MKTSKLISTISYNSEEFLTNFLNSLVTSRKVAFWCYVKHIGEELEDHTHEKDHIHLFIEPNTQLDTMDLQKLSEEFDPDHPDHPLKCIYFHRSVWEDWLFYGLHDLDYLRLKLEKREFAYSYDDLKASDPDELFERYNAALHSSKMASLLKLPKLLKDHTVAELTAMGFVQPDQAYNFSIYERLLARGNEELRHKRTHD